MSDEIPYFHNKNIKIGHGRILYSGRDGSGLTPAWVLPGGMRTSNEVVAREFAARIDHFTRHGRWPQ